MSKLMRVYCDCILNEKMFFFYTEIMISAAHMLGGMPYPARKFLKNVQFDASW